MQKAVCTLLVIFTLVVIGIAQDRAAIPLTQQEYVRLLYKAERNPSSISELIEAVRFRGIDFVMTNGLRRLTKSKSRNNNELIRTIDEANRRRENPEAARRPSTTEALAAIETTREKTLAAVDEMPDFVVKQRITRSLAFAGTNNFRGRDRLIVGVSYQANGRERYRLLSKNGVVFENAQSKSSYSEVGGTSSTGEFVTVLATIFKPESLTRFYFVDTDQIRKRPTLVYDFSVRKEQAKQVITSSGFVSASTISGMSGRIWIDREKSRVLRLESNATEIPVGFPITHAKRFIDYNWVDIGGELYLLPMISDVRLTFRHERESYESKNYIQFKDYQKFGTEVEILDDDTEFVEESKKDGGPPPLTPTNPTENAPPPLKPPVKKDN